MLHFEKLWISVIVSAIFCDDLDLLQSFLDRDQEIHLSVCVRANI